MKTVERGVSIDVLNSLLSLDPSTGFLFWKKREPSLFNPTSSVRTKEHAASYWNARYANERAFASISSNGYFCGRIFTRRFAAHRVVYAIYNGFWPENQIDHIDGNPLNNVPANLRDVTQFENMRNTSMRPDNKSGHVGVCWIKKDRVWRSSISINGKRLSLGEFKSKSDAVRARVMAEEEFGYHENHGRKAA